MRKSDHCVFLFSAVDLEMLIKGVVTRVCSNTAPPLSHTVWERAQSEPPVGAHGPASDNRFVRRKLWRIGYISVHAFPPKVGVLFFHDPLTLPSPPYHSRPEQRGHVSASAHRNQDAAIIMALLHSCWKPAVAHHGSESSKSLSPLWPPAWLTAAPPSRTSHSHVEKKVCERNIMARKMPVVWPHQLHFTRAIVRCFNDLPNILLRFSWCVLRFLQRQTSSDRKWEYNKKGNIQRAFLQGIIPTSAK